jgi:hypothetical protein
MCVCVYVCMTCCQARCLAIRGTCGGRWTDIVCVGLHVQDILPWNFGLWHAAMPSRHLHTRPIARAGSRVDLSSNSL